MRANCELYDFCPLKKCDECKDWYLNYVKYCKENNVTPTSLKPQAFSSYDLLGEKMNKSETIIDKISYEEAAKELGIRAQTVQKYICAGRLERAGKGFVTKRSLEEYKKERVENKEKIKSNLKTIGKLIEEDMNKTEEIKEQMGDKKVVMTIATLMDALRAAYQKGKAETLKKYDEVDLETLMKEFIPKIGA